jgi:hypothetical protein
LLHHAVAASALLLADYRRHREMEQNLEDEERSHGYDFTSLLVQYPLRRSADQCVAMWKVRQPAIQALNRHGMFGAEQMYVSAGEKDEEFVRWADDLLVNQIEKQTDQAPNLLAVFLEHHRAIARRMQEDPGFAARFQEDLWLKFLKLSAEPKLGAVLFHGGVWDVLQVEGGEDLLRRYGPAAIVIFSGEDALPADPGLRDAATVHLKGGLDGVVRALCDKQIRKNKDFHALMKRGLRKEVFAVLCQRLQNGRAEELLADYAKMPNQQLEAETTGVDVNRWPAESYLPQLVYVRLGIKVLSGETLYGVEKKALVMQIASDLVEYGLPQTGAAAGGQVVNRKRSLVGRELRQGGR